QDGQLRAAQEQKELQRQQLHQEVAGYREQSKQHSLTILALEDRLLEAAQQQKMLEEEKAALVEKMEGLWPIPDQRVTPGDQKAGVKGMLRFVLIFPRKLQEELAVAQGMLLEKTAAISRLTRELSETRARMSDMRGELSEEQKVELEHSQRQLKHREGEVNQLREKLSEMSNLVEEKDRALKAAAEELRYTLTSPEASQMPLCVSPAADGVQGSPQSKRHILGKNHSSACFFQEPPPDLAELGAKCRGLRHEEMIQRQKEGLAELRERVKILERRQCSGAVRNYSEPLVVRMKDLAEKIVQQRGLEMEPAPVLGEKLKAGKVTDHVPNEGSFRLTNSTASLEMAEVTDFGEKMYLDVIGALGSLMEMKELSGMQPLQHLPQEKRTEVGLQRQKALELLYKKIRNLQIRLERKEEMLKGYEGSVEQLRQNQASLRRCQQEMSSLEDEAHREAEEKALLREALERTQLQLDQEKRLRRAAKRHKV
ncbi:FHAD1 protein, partial [Dyaphorophyia castanea]|nr:FHAD1 protein [Platysteira castanea]